jgi:hypothetical protein
MYNLQKLKKEFIMKKTLLALVVLAAAAAQAAPFNPATAWGDAPGIPARPTSGGGLGSLGALAGGAGSAATGMPPVNLGVGVATSVVKANANQASSIRTGDNSSNSIGVSQQLGQDVYGTASATGMGK